MTVHHWILLHAPAVALPSLALSYLLLLNMGGPSAPAGDVAFTSGFSHGFH